MEFSVSLPHLSTAGQPKDDYHHLEALHVRVYTLPEVNSNRRTFVLKNSQEVGNETK